MTETPVPYRTKLPRPPSAGEESLALQLRAAGIQGWVRESTFHPTRRWRWDYCWPAQMLAVEIQGGTWQGRSAHGYGKGYTRDCDKHNEGTLLGWRILVFTTEMVENGTALKYIQAALR